MAQPSNENESQSPRLNNHWVHKRTLMVVSCFVILPWILIAIPGTDSGGAGTTGLNVDQKWHGWPFVHLVSTRVTVYGNWVNNRFFPGQIPQNLDLDGLANKWTAEFNRDVERVQLDLRFQREEIFGDNLRESGFWSESSNWPFPETGLQLTPRYIGLFLNLLFVSLIVSFVGAISEYRIRRHHRLFRFSIRSLMLFIAVTVLVLAWSVRESSRATTSAILNHSLSQLDDDGKLFFSVDYETRFPQVISQLLNHRKPPWGSISICSRVKSGNIKLNLEEGAPPDEIERIARLAMESGYAITLNVLDFNSERQTMLCAFDGTNVVDLTIDLDAYDWVYQVIGDEFHGLDWEKAVVLPISNWI